MLGRGKFIGQFSIAWTGFMKWIKSFNPSYHQTNRAGNRFSLSLGYDIIKAYGGVPIAIEIKVETKEGEGVEFIIQLPVV